jgi:hypothetical protein
MIEVITIKSKNIYTDISPVSSDLVILDTADGIFSTELKNLIFKNYNAEFITAIDDTDLNIEEVSVNMPNILTIADTAKRYSNFLALYYVNKTVDGEDIIINNQVDFLLPTNHIGVNTMEDFYIAKSADVISDKSIYIDSGTYKVTGAAAFSIRNPGEYADEILTESYGCNVSTDIRLLDNPQRTMVIGDIKYTPAQRLKGKTSVTTSIDGFFYMCKPGRIGYRVSTDGNLSVGDGSLAALSAVNSIQSQRNYNSTSCPVQLILEKISDEDIFNLLSVDLDS